MSYAFRLLARLFQRLCGVTVAALDRHARMPGDRRPTSDAFDRDLFFCVFLRIHRLSGKRFGENIKGPLMAPASISTLGMVLRNSAAWLTEVL